MTEFASGDGATRLPALRACLRGVKRRWRIGALLAPYQYDVIHGAWFDRTIPRGGKDVVKRSIARYVAAVRGDGSAELQ